MLTASDPKAQLDARILEVLKRGPARLGELRLSVGRQHKDALVHYWKIDCALQRLKRRGKIRYVLREWRLS